MFRIGLLLTSDDVSRDTETSLEEKWTAEPRQTRGDGLVLIAWHGGLKLRVRPPENDEGHPSQSESEPIDASAVIHTAPALRTFRCSDKLLN